MNMNFDTLILIIMISPISKRNLYLINHIIHLLDLLIVVIINNVHMKNFFCMY